MTRSLRSFVCGGALGLGTACFAAPHPPVLFACEPDGAAECPAGYACQADGCCHRDGSDFEAHAGSCRLGMGDGPPQTTTIGGDTETTGTGIETAGTDEADASATTGTGSETAGTDDTGTDDTGSSATTGTDTTGTDTTGAGATTDRGDVDASTSMSP